MNLGDIYGPDKVYLDCGASTGIESVSYTDVFGAIHSFEPGVEDYRCLKENLKHYNNCTTHSAALSNENSTATLVNYASGRINHLDFIAAARKKNIGTSTVVTRTLDSYDFNNVSYIKIDVEGFEADVLASGSSSLTSNLPWIQVEINNNQDQIEKLLATFGHYEYVPIKSKHNRLYIPKQGKNKKLFNFIK